MLHFCDGNPILHYTFSQKREFYVKKKNVLVQQNNFKEKDKWFM